jgi:preprotein translocase subunit YajC
VNGAVMMIFYVLLFVAIFYFLAVRPQRRQKAQHSEMMRAMKKGDEVITVGGMYGTVRKIGPDWVDVEVARGTRIRFLKRAISTITTVPDEEEYVEEEEYDEAEDAEAAGELEAGDEEEDAEGEEEDAEGEEEYAEGEEEEAYDEAEEEEPVAEEPVKPSRPARRRK